MSIQSEFEEFLKFLTDHETDFVNVGGYAVAFHGFIRATQDIDIFFRNTEDNARRVIAALCQFGLRLDDTDIPDFLEPGASIRLGIPPAKIELINMISGVSFEEVWEHRAKGRFGDVEVAVISYADLIANKKASGRPKDIIDVEELTSDEGE